MKTINSTIIVRTPVNQLWKLMRDDLPRKFEALEHIDKIVELERRVAECGSVLTVRSWSATLPRIAQLAANSKSIVWQDSSVWEEQMLKCSWSINIVSPQIEEASTCFGSAVYESALAGKGTKIGLETTLDLGSGNASSESIIGELIIANFSKIFRTISQN